MRYLFNVLDRYHANTETDMKVSDTIYEAWDIRRRLPDTDGYHPSRVNEMKMSLSSFERTLESVIPSNLLSLVYDEVQEKYLDQRKKPFEKKPADKEDELKGMIHQFMMKHGIAETFPQVVSSQAQNTPTPDSRSPAQP